MNRTDWTFHADDADSDLLWADCDWCGIAYQYHLPVTLDEIMRDVLSHNARMHPLTSKVPT